MTNTSLENSKNSSIHHHYVPQWYQRLFLLEGQNNYDYFDKSPQLMSLPNGRQKRDKNLRRQGVRKCFAQDHLYSMFSVKKTDFLETHFFGEIDRCGSLSFPVFINDRILYEGHEYLYYFLEFMGAQRLRTPKGLLWVKKILYQMDPDARLFDENTLKECLLHLLVKIREIHRTIWTEGVWEVVSAEKSDVKFIISDNPVAFYNPKIFPLNNASYGFHNIMIDLIGTRTIYPLDINHCLIITNRQYALNPGKDSLKVRTNSRVFGKSHFNVLDIIRDRHLATEEVIQINSILEDTAHRYVASANAEWLQAQKKMRKVFWPKRDKILLPDKKRIKKTGGSVIAGDGFISGSDLYGQPLPKVTMEAMRKMKEKIQQTPPGSKVLAD